jgi:hypothetical protein
MRFPLLLIYEGDGRLAGLLQPLAEEKRWSLRQPQQPRTCLEAIARSGPTVLVLKLGRDLERELSLLERIGWLYPDAAVVATLDEASSPLFGMAWDLGAAYVHQPPQPIELVAEVVAGLMGATP